MLENGNWGGNLELSALSKCLNFNCIIHMKDRPTMVIRN